MPEGIELVGAKELENLFKQLPDRVARKVLRKAVSKALTPVRRAARANAPVDSGNLKASIVRKIKTYARTQTVYGMVGPRSRAAPYAHLVEDGTRLRFQKHSGRFAGRVKAVHFLLKAMDENKSQIQSTMEQVIRQGVESEAAALGKT